ncbi:MAG: potassium transporter [Gammaproteobacteria bacterium]|nr:potassium transporter [Gammaproteobacteria bacterium]
MNYSLIQRILGIMLMLFGLSLIIPIITSVLYQDQNINIFITSFIIFLLAGLILYYPNREQENDIRTKEGFLIVVLFWVVLSIFGSIPFMLDKQLSLSFADALFESVSGWTTTGATILSNIDTLSPSILIYRQMLQWLGGMGIVILALAILPMLGVGGMQLYKAESTGPIKDTKISPRIAETAQNLWSVYLGLTFLCALSYFLAGMNLFDAIGHSFSTIAIGGFSTHDKSIGFFDNTSIEIICMIFMLLSAMNFILHFLSLKSKSIKVYFEDSELMTYLMIILFFIFLIMIYATLDSNFTNLRHVFFQTVSFITTSGFTSTSYNLWPSFILSTLLTASFIGACAGSTGGGMKVIRVILLFKLIKRELLKILHPSAELPVKINEKLISEDISATAWNFFILYLISYFVISLTLLATGVDTTTAFSAVASCINNLGPALGSVYGNYSSINDFSKYLLSFTMLLGRLEIFTLLIIMTPYFWKY